MQIILDKYTCVMSMQTLHNSQYGCAEPLDILIILHEAITNSCSHVDMRAKIDCPLIIHFDKIQGHPLATLLHNNKLIYIICM